MICCVCIIGLLVIVLLLLDKVYYNGYCVFYGLKIKSSKAVVLYYGSLLIDYSQFCDN